MRKILFLIGIILFGACETDVEMISKGKVVYSVNCILNPDTSYQSLTIGKVYKNINDTSMVELKNAVVIIKSGKDTFVFNETGKLNKSLKNGLIYTHNNFTPIEGKKYTLEVKLKNDVILSSMTEVPYIYLLIRDFSTYVPDLENGTAFHWNNVNGDNYQYASFIRLLINYKYNIGNGVFVNKSYEVPRALTVDDGKIKKLFPKVEQYPYFSFENNVFENAFNEIIANDTNRTHYKEFKPEIRLFFLDTDLSRYIRMDSEYFESFSILLDSYDYSNIKGGAGIFGSYVVWTSKIIEEFEISPLLLKKFRIKNY